jgi:hypothetical protein
MGRPAHRRRWLLGLAAAVVILVVAVGFLVDEPMRRRMEAELNARLDGYAVRVGRLDFHPLGFSLDLEDLTIVQEAHPDPPVAQIARVTASVQWRELVRGAVVADFAVVRPTIHLNREQERAELEDPVPVTERGWQEAVQAIYPLKINAVEVRQGDVTYVEEGFRPLRLTDVRLHAGNIRNVRSKPGEYPSELRLDARVFESGSLMVKGRADFLAVPHAALKTRVELGQLPLDYLQPIARRYHTSLQRGTLSLRGEVEYAPGTRMVALDEMTMQRAAVEYVQRGSARDAESAAQVASAAKKVAEGEPHTRVRARRIEITESRLGLVNETTDPPYRLFFDATRVLLENFSNRPGDPPAGLRVDGRFMGSGPTEVRGRFRQDVDGPELDLLVRIENTDLRTLNDLFRAYGKFDVADGQFAVYSEVHVDDGTIRGYVKPFFADLDVYDPEQDEKKGLARRTYEGIVGGVAGLLENRDRDEVATRTEISGRIDNPRTSILDVVVNLVRNAFFQAILPGFERRGRGG